MFTLETLPKYDNYCLLDFILRNVLTFEVTIDILMLVKRYSFNPLYNPYILIIYTPLNEKRPLSGRFSFYMKSGQCRPFQQKAKLFHSPFHQPRIVLTRKPPNRNRRTTGARKTNTLNTTVSKRITTNTTIPVTSHPGSLMCLPFMVSS